MLEIKLTKTMGRGVFAAKNIKAGTVVNVSETLVVKKSGIGSKCVLLDYFYDFDRNNFLLALGYGSLFNHSKTPNIEVARIEVGKRHLLEYTALMPIKKGEQLFFNYAMPNEYD